MPLVQPGPSDSSGQRPNAGRSPKNMKGHSTAGRSHRRTSDGIAKPDVAQDFRDKAMNYLHASKLAGVPPAMSAQREQCIETDLSASTSHLTVLPAGETPAVPETKNPLALECRLQ